MKLLHNEILDKIVMDNEVNEYSSTLVKDLRNNEEKFYKMFDINPCPMSIHELKTGTIIDINQSFLKIIGLKNRIEIVGKNEKFNILNDKDQKIFVEKVEKEGVVRNMPIQFKNLSNKKIKGLFSGTYVQLNDIKYLLVICQIIDKKCLLNYFLL
jgi:PAS domain-containing protein